MYELRYAKKEKMRQGVIEFPAEDRTEQNLDEIKGIHIEGGKK